MPRLRIWPVAGGATESLLENYVTAEDLAVAARHHRALRARQTLVARAVLRCLLQEETGHRGDQWSIAKEASGRPVAIFAAGHRGPDVSIAHSGQWVACGLIGKGRIGVDIEVPRAGRCIHDIARAMFSPAEQNAVDLDGEAAFLAFWTMREAIGKALGTGVSGGIEVAGDDLVSARGQSAAVVRGERPWSLTHRHGPDFSMAVAWSQSAPLPTRVKRVS